MGYRIPREAEVVDAINKVLVRDPVIRSQTELAGLVGTELRRVDGDYRISGSRIRRIGIHHGLFSLDISYAHPSKMSEHEDCPVCGEELESVMNRTLDGKSVILMRKCGRCGYTEKPDAVKPAMYGFERRTDGTDAIEKLTHAMELLNEAADLMDEALHMSGLEFRCKGDSDAIRRLASADDYGGSLANLIRDLEYRNEEQPNWTQPLVSPKKQFRPPSVGCRDQSL